MFLLLSVWAYRSLTWLVPQLNSALEATGKLPHPAPLRHLPPALEIGPPIGGPLDVHGPQRRDVLEPPELLALVLQRAAHPRGALPRPAVERGLERAVPREQVRRRLLADPLRARQAVGGVAPQGDEVRHLLGRDAVAALHLGRVDLLDPPRPGLDEQDLGALAGALVHVAVAGHDQGAAARVLLGP